MSNTSTSPRFGILYPGEMGAAFGRILKLQGFEVLTALTGRSEATREYAKRAEIADVRDLEQLLGQVDFVLSFVPPSAAMGMAETVAACLPPRAHLVFVDFNSIAPDIAEEIADCLGKHRVDFVDGSIHGQARNLATSAAVYLSGPRARELGEILSEPLRIYDLGADVVAASRFKMLLAALSKSLVSVFLQAGLLAERADQLQLFLDQARYFYPGLMDAIERMAPTYPQHARRRVGEMIEVERTVSRLGLRQGMVTETRRFLQELASADLPASKSTEWTTENLIKALAAAGVLREGEECEQ